MLSTAFQHSHVGKLLDAEVDGGYIFKSNLFFTVCDIFVLKCVSVINLDLF